MIFSSWIKNFAIIDIIHEQLSKCYQCCWILFKSVYSACEPKFSDSNSFGWLANIVKFTELYYTIRRKKNTI